MTKELYELLISIKDKMRNFDNSTPPQLAKLQQNKFVVFQNLRNGEDYTLVWKLTDYAIEEMEKYEKSLRQENREIESLRIAEEAKCKAEQANKISIWAMVISAAIGLIAVGASLLIAFLVK